jgi:hypothetical protein
MRAARLEVVLRGVSARVAVVQAHAVREVRDLIGEPGQHALAKQPLLGVGASRVAFG